jgi:hypothetical protein
MIPWTNSSRWNTRAGSYSQIRSTTSKSAAANMSVLPTEPSHGRRKRCSLPRPSPQLRDCSRW